MTQPQHPQPPLSTDALAPARYPAELPPPSSGPPDEAEPPSEVVRGRLWIAGYPADYAWVRAHGVTVVADLADADAHPEPGDLDGVAYLKHPFVDTDELPDLVVIEGLAAALVDAVVAGRRVLVHCTYGRNRSGLVTALVLRGLLGIDGRTALGLVRERRYRAVNNALFAAYLEKLPGPEPAAPAAAGLSAQAQAATRSASPGTSTPRCRAAQT